MNGMANFRDTPNPALKRDAAKARRPSTLGYKRRKVTLGTHFAKIPA